MRSGNFSLITANRASAILYNFIYSQNTAAGGLWVLPSNACPVLLFTLLKANRQVYLADISVNDLLLNCPLLKENLKGQIPEGIIFIDTYGFSGSTDGSIEYLKLNFPETLLVHDRCLSVPELNITNSLADLVLYSTGYAKYVELNTGGYAYIAEGLNYKSFSLKGDDAKYKEQENKLRSLYGSNKMFDYVDSAWLTNELLSFNDAAYFDQISSALEKANKQKQLLNSIYTSLLPKSFTLKQEFQHWRFQLLVPEKEVLLRSIVEVGLFASSHYKPLSAVFGSNNCLVASQLAADVVNLFNDHYFDEAKAEKLAKLINQHLDRFENRSIELKAHWKEVLEHE